MHRDTLRRIPVSPSTAPAFAEFLGSAKPHKTLFRLRAVHLPNDMPPDHLGSPLPNRIILGSPITVSSATPTEFETPEPNQPEVQMEDAQTATPIQAPTRKRTRAASPIQPPIQPTFQFQASPPIEFPQYSTIQQCIYAAQGLIQKAAQLARPSPAENSRLLDLLEVFREYTQKGRLPATSSIIHAQV